MPRRPGFTLVELLLVTAVVGLLTALSAAGVQRARAAADRARCGNHLRQLGLALHQYHQSRGALPPGTAGPADPTPFLAWHARLLPYLGRAAEWAEVEAAFRADKDF